MQINRKWAMPSSDTFDVSPIGEFVKLYLRQSKISIDPFARNKRWATYTNDINPNTAAEYHLDVVDFLKMLIEKKVKADLMIFDPPYSPRQAKEMYSSFGKSVTKKDTQMATIHASREYVRQILDIGGICLSFGWNSTGMGLERGFEIIEILLVAHGAFHNDTICMAEKKIAFQNNLFSYTATHAEPFHT
jgi:hypothetical protein